MQLHHGWRERLRGHGVPAAGRDIDLLCVRGVAERRDLFVSREHVHGNDGRNV